MGTLNFAIAGNSDAQIAKCTFLNVFVEKMACLDGVVEDGEENTYESDDY